jgi:hypothetical protein
MQLELHDAEAGNTLKGTVSRLDLDYQAEQWVQDLASDRRHNDIIKWVLKDGQGVRAVWERPVGDTGMPEITQRSPRFQGQWERGAKEVAIP